MLVEGRFVRIFFREIIGQDIDARVDHDGDDETSRSVVLSDKEICGSSGDIEAHLCGDCLCESHDLCGRRAAIRPAHDQRLVLAFIERDQC